MKRLGWFLIIALTLTITMPSMAADPIPDWVVFPEEEWETITPEEAGLDVEGWNAWVASKSPEGYPSWGQNPELNFGIVLTRGGYLLQTWGDPDFIFQSSSVGKAFTMACLQLAIEEGIITSGNDLVKDYWIGEGQLSHPHKYLNNGYHNSLTFNHLKDHMGGFPVTNGWMWGNNQDVPSWAQWTGDPFYDNYAHIAPGTQSQYSSGGMWRLSQALTKVWDKELKDVLDEKLFSRMGISPDDWDWVPGQVVHDDFDWYPEMPGYGGFVDPPYVINGHVVQGGGGWVVMSAKDLARWGLLVATGGIWKGERLIGHLTGHYGGNGSFAGGVGGEEMSSVGRLTTSQSIEFPSHLIIGPVSKDPTTPSPGDLNADGAINILDVQLCVNVMHDIEKNPEIVQRADVNRDGTVDEVDIQLMIGKVLEG